MKTAYLVLENGSVFKGESFGYETETVGELVFNTGMVGYLEALSDPSYFGQILIQTFPLIGNYGVIPSDLESGKVQVKAYIVREWCQDPSNFRSEGSLDAFLNENKIPGLCNIDTRALTKIIREKGVMNAMISKTPELTSDQWQILRDYKVKDGVSAVTCTERYAAACENPKYNVALWDFGARRSITEKFTQHGCSVTIVPGSTTAEQIAELKPDGIVLSNGPGDPSDNTDIIEQIKKICKLGIPVFGIGLGHQLLALSQGARTEKLHYGHNGSNQPVLNTLNGQVFVTGQNHGYTVTKDSLPETAFQEYENCNDGTCEGITYTNMPAFSVQFYPEASIGLQGSQWLFNRFTDMMDINKEGGNN